jgi:hypothetical protein
MSILELFRYLNERIFCSNIGIRDVNVGCRISLTSRPMSMPTYEDHLYNFVTFHRAANRTVPVSGHAESMNKPTFAFGLFYNLQRNK